ncbi:MAG: hypothetical protein V1800_00220 [Candidatus Latescibacterota bacterium]
MAGQTYYVNPEDGDDANCGLTADQPFKTHAHRAFAAGDTVLFKRGSVCREGLHTCDGTDQGYITYGAYGKGNKPVFLGSVPADEPDRWIEERPSVWRYTSAFPSEVCNLVFSGGESCGHLRWQVANLQHQGEWHYTALGASTAPKGSADAPRCEDGVLYLYSSRNPARFYDSIECALWGRRRLVGGRRHIILEDLAFANSGVHCYQDSRVNHVIIRKCDFRFIGGAVWRKDRRIRFGNAVEFWDGVQDSLVEDCVFENIYDAGVTHQGSPESDVPERVHFRNNLFVHCGIGAYECRGPAAREIYFENNTCVHAGGDLSMQGEPSPRQSEIYPQPMGNHVFIWRIDWSNQMGPIYIRNNIFYEAPHSAAIYSIIDPEDERNLVIDHNCYWQTTGNTLCLLNGKTYRPADWPRYQAECRQDTHSLLADPKFINPEASDYRLRQDTPCPDAGRKE